MKRPNVFAAVIVAGALTLAVPLTGLADVTQPGSPASAGSTTVEPLTATASAASTQPQPAVQAGLTPDSPLYFLDRLFESVELFLTRNPESRVRLYVSFARERLAELRLVANQKGAGDDLKAQVEAQQLADGVVKMLDSAGATLEMLKLENGDVKIAAQVKQAADLGEDVVRGSSVLPGAVTPQLLRQLNQAGLLAGAVAQVKVESMAEAKAAGARPGKLEVKVEGSGAATGLSAGGAPGSTPGQTAGPITAAPDAADRLVTYTYEVKDGKVETKLAIAEKSIKAKKDKKEKHEEEREEGDD